MKTAYKLAIIALAGILTASCNKEVAGPAEENEGRTEEISFRVISSSYDVKTILGDETGHKSVTWAEGDQVKVYYGTAATACVTAPVDVDGVIRTKVQSGAFKNFYAVYPAATTAAMKTTTTFQVTIPDQQDGSFSGANIMAAHADAGRVLQFHNAASLLQVEIGRSDIDKVVVRSNDGTAICGPVTFTFDQTAHTITNMAPVGGSAELTLNISGAGKYYIALLPGVNLNAGLAFRFFKNGTPVSAVLSRTAMPTAASDIITVGRIDDKLTATGDFFVKKNGTGDGSSWSEAASPAKLFALLNARCDDGTLLDGEVLCWRAPGTIHVAEGSYTYEGSAPLALAASNGVLNIVGGYYEGSTGTDLSRYDPAQYHTVFAADESMSVLELFGSNGGIMNIRGITVSGASVTDNGGGIKCNAPGLVVNFKDCTFSGNVTSAQGGAMALEGGEFHFDDCTFAQNQATTTIANSTSDTEDAREKASHGGAIYANGENVKLYINRCLFKSNVAFFGADLEVRRGADCYIYRTAFIGSQAMAGTYFGNYYGRSINADAMPDGKQGEICLCNCTITKTGSVYSGNGGLPQLAPTSYFCMACLTTFHDPSIANYRNNNRSGFATDLNWIVGNLFVNSNNNAINLASKSAQHGFYNILNTGKNSYANLAETDSKVAEQDFITMKFDSDKNIYTWTIDETAHPIKRPTRTEIADIVSANAPSFDAWLKTLVDDGEPYLYDLTGKKRNPGQITPGSWDRGL